MLIMCRNLSSSTLFKNFSAEVNYWTDTAGRFATGNIAGSYKGSTLPVNALQFTFSAGNITNGKFTLIGLK